MSEESFSFFTVVEEPQYDLRAITALNQCFKDPDLSEHFIYVALKRHHDHKTTKSELKLN